MELAVGASDSAMRSLLGKLGSLLAQEYALISSVRSEIQYIKDELTSMHAFLRNLNYAAADDHDEQTKDWMEQVRDVAYDIEDCVDDFSHRLRGQPRGEGLLADIRRAWYAMTTVWERRSIATKIVDLKDRAQGVGERRTRYGVKDPGPDAAAKASTRATPSYHANDHPQPAPQLVSATEPVGMEEAIEQLGPWLTEGSNDHLKVLAIVGFGGLGKTTLALALQRKFGEKFESRASVQASQKLHRVSLLRSILKQVLPKIPDGVDEWGLKKLEEELKTHLEKKRYFILIDDVWSVSAWEEIWVSLPKNSNGSRIMLTTRFKSVAEASSSQQTGRTYPLERLSDDKSKDLFFEKIFGGNDPNPNEFRDTKYEILKKCGGLPLAIVAVAGLLARDRKSESHWMKVHTSLSSELEVNLTPEGVTQILNLCYNDLQADQKNCLLYLSIFPKGYSINRKRLVRRWIAEGFIIEKQGKTVEEVAEDYFNELISRNIIRPVDHNSNGKVKTYQVHDMILEYIVSKSSKENFITVLGGHWHTATPGNKVRRLSLHSSDPDSAKSEIENMNLSHVRSLTAFDSLERLQSFSFKFGILQVLDLEGCKGLTEIHLRKICKMFHLKYLSLRKTSIKKLPSAIGKLIYLETLDIRETNVEVLPDSVADLKQMAHLLGGNKSTRAALRFTDGIAKMTALQTLSGIGISQRSSRALGGMHNLTKLRKLSIYSIADFDKHNQKYGDLLSAIEYLSGCSLKYLAVDDGFTGFLDLVVSSSSPPKYIHTLELSGKLPKVPQWINELKKLEKLTLSLTSLRTHDLFVLAQLPLLFSLTFSVNAARQDHSVMKVFLRNTMDSRGNILIPSDGFHSLRLLRFSAPVLPLLSFLEGAMPKLQRLELRFKVLEGAYGVENLVSLQQVLLRVSQQASETTKVKVSDIRSSVRMHPNKPTVVVDEYY
ncbi:Disease resistance protein RPM1 [Triticum urartu]|uniref:Disease resistance protein RPM1 n=3 Tax=Triticum urartu TaxID=4572 RepID=M8A9N4_TRIUA|nr:disease resistance protein Pik-2-like [Triticum urartu]XP_048568536.1 disease resistance protein Pik-2-like [Triticum urartu]EMS57199.1 Disease resistance protein RPM1 [Triticum urartu]